MSSSITGGYQQHFLRQALLAHAQAFEQDHDGILAVEFEPGLDEVIEQAARITGLAEVVPQALPMVTTSFTLCSRTWRVATSRRSACTRCQSLCERALSLCDSMACLMRRSVISMVARVFWCT